MIRIAYVDTSKTGRHLEVTGAEGVMRAARIDPHGVVVVINETKLSITPNALTEIGLYFLAAAVALGEDINPPVVIPNGH